MSLRNGIKELIKVSSISIRQLSIKSGVRRQSIMHFLSGGNIHIENLEKIVFTLGYGVELKASKSLLAQRIPVAQKKLADFCKKNGISFFAIFGSVLRKDFNKGSDIDIMVKFAKPVTFFELADIEEKLKKLLQTKHKLDIVTAKSVSPLLVDEINKKCEVLYEEAA